MIDDETNVRELMEALRGHLPMRVYATPPLVEAARQEGAGINVNDVVEIDSILYLGDVGGIAWQQDCGGARPLWSRRSLTCELTTNIPSPSGCRPINYVLAVGYLAGRTWWQRLAYWLFAFGVWDICYYVWLYVYLRWPTSPRTKDLLFLIPGEWWAPVWQPVLASLGLVAVAALILAKTRR